MKKDSNLFSKFILWLKKIFHIQPKIEYKRRTVEVTPQPEEKTIKDTPPKEKTRKVSQDGKKPVYMPLPEKKTTEVTPLPEQRPLGTPSKKESQEPFGEEILPTEPSQGSDALPAREIEIEPQIKYPPEEVKTEEKYIQKEEKDTMKPQKPYKKKVPTEEGKKEPIKLPTTPIETKTPSPKQRKTIHLGDTQRRKRSLTGTHQKPVSVENIEKETDVKVPEEKEFATTVESPYVEINLDNAEVYLTLPKQQFKANTVDERPQQTSYSVDLNGIKQEVLVRITTNRDGLMFVEERRIPLEEPLVKFQVAFPDEIQGGEYNYKHNDKEFYVFVAIGNNRGRMYYLYDKEGKIIDLPKRDVWILLGEDFELQTEPNVIEERWIWGKYWPFRIDLSEIDSLVIKNRISGEEKSFALQSTFHVEGEQLIEDNYKKECPLFTGKTLKIVAPYENQSGWSVWIQNKTAGYKIKEIWTGRELLTLRLPDDLPCEFGEFQVDICQQNTRISDETLFFRFMPCLELNYPKELIIPNPKLGHTPSNISVKLDSDDKWELKHKESGEIKVNLKQHNFYEIELPPERDAFRFSLAQATRPDSVVNFQITIPRLKWRYSKQKTWNGISQKIERKDLKLGEPFYLLIQTNDFDNKYDLLAILETNGQKLQEGRFIRKGMEHSLKLNQFFDTITHNKDELILKVEVRKGKDNALLGKPEILYFPTKLVIEKPLLPKYDLIQAISLPKICSVLRWLKDTCPKERVNSKNILQHYYRKIRGKKRDKRYINKDKRIFVIKSLAFIKYIMDTYGERAQIKGQKKWRKRIDLLQQEYPEEIKEHFDTFSRR